MFCKVVVTFTVVFILMKLCTAAKILAILPVHCRSHDSWHRAVLTELTNRGHEITVLSADHDLHYYHRGFQVEGVYELMESSDLLYMTNFTFFDSVFDIFDWAVHSCKSVIISDASKKLLALSKNETFDLMIVDSITQECVYGYAEKFGSPPIVAVYPFGHSPWLGWILGNIPNPAYVPLYDFPFSDYMNFHQRIINLFATAFILMYRTYIHIPQQEKLCREYFHTSESFNLEQSERNVSLTLINTNFVLDYPHPLLPNVIPVGGLHIKPARKLPKDLQEKLDQAKDGFIYFSLGSVVRSAFMTLDKQQIFLQAFSALPELVLWKWESDNIMNSPANVITEKWVSQNDVLAHPNIRLFISHGGLLSTQEAAYHGVPLLGIPIYADQHVNSYKAKSKGFGEILSYNDLTSDILLETIEKIIRNSSYMTNAKKISRIFKGEPQRSMKSAVYWIEYAIKHRGAPHLQPASKTLPLYQLLLLDVLVTVVFTVILCYFLSKLMFKILCRFFKFYFKSTKLPSRENHQHED